MSATQPPPQARGIQQSIRSKALPPRPPPGPSGPLTQSSRSRTSHACDRCRLMRTKCSGGVRCTKCTKDGQTCIYGDGKREKNKKELAESGDRISDLQEEVNMLVTALRAISIDPAFNAEAHPAIFDVLSRYADEDMSQSDSFIDGEMSDQLASPIDPRFRGSRRSSVSQKSNSFQVGGLPRTNSESWGEKRTPAAVGSPATQNRLEEAVDLDFGTGAAGFMGKMSEVSWIQRIKEYMLTMPLLPNESTETLQMRYDRHARDTRTSNYFMDDVDLLSVDEDHVVAHEMPPPELSLLLAEACFHAMQDAFLFVHRERFLEALALFPRKKSPLFGDERRWLALANLVFAVGAKWLQQTEPGSEPIMYDHLEFYARARALGLDHRVVFDHPLLEQIQALGLLAYYLFVNGSIFRAWTILGHAIRHAIALGLHLRVADNVISETDRMHRARTWYSLYSLEILVSEVTGRPRAIAASDITTPIAFRNAPYGTKGMSEHTTQHYGTEAESRRLWQKFLMQARPTSLAMLECKKPLLSLLGIGTGAPVSHFSYRVRLCFISQQIATALYSANENCSWSDLQDRTQSLEAELTHWYHNLPSELSMEGSQGFHVDPRSKIELAMYYYSIRMILHRPCLCNIQIDNESPQSRLFDLDSARKCVEAAIAMSDFIPDLQSPQEAFLLLPWWSLLHYVSQAIAILLLEICLGSVHFPAEEDVLIFSLKRAMLHLYRMTSASRSAYKAWKIFRHILDRAGIEFTKLDVSDVPIDAPQPSNWSAAFETSLQDQDLVVHSPLAGFLAFPQS